MAWPTSSHSSGFSRRRALKLLGGAGLAAAGLSAGGCGVTFTKGTPPISNVGLDKKPAPGRKHNIELYSVWGGPTGEGLVKLAQRFEQAQEDIGVRVVYAPAGVGGGSVQQKLFVAIAGRNPPDVAQLVPSQTPQWAALGIMTDLTDRFKAAGLSKDDFFDPTWPSMEVDGKIWQMQWDADPNFPFFWNKNLFEEAGLDPERPPETVEELDEYSAKILKKDGANVTRIGTVPWDWYGASNSMFTWGWAFGGTFYDEATQTVTPDHEQNIKALEWIVKYAEKVGGKERVSVTPPGLQLHPFSTGNIGMSPLVSPNFRDILANVPDMKVGTGQLPYAPPAKGVGAGAWLGGWGMFIPRGARDPDAAWEFIRWVSATDEGTVAQWETVGFPCAYKKSPVMGIMEKDEVWKPYHEVLVTATNIRPPMTVSDFFFQNLDFEVTKALAGESTPAQALRAVREHTNDEIERFKREVGLV